MKTSPDKSFHCMTCLAISLVTFLKCGLSRNGVKSHAFHFKDGILQNSLKYINDSGGGILLETSSESAP